MTLFKKASVFLIILLLCAAVWLSSAPHQKDVVTPKEDSGLRMAVNTCQDTTERAAAHLTAVVEFQKLEIAGRKAHVFKMCMQDRGYIENASWLTVSTPIAESVAKEAEVSVDAALENLRRTSMIMTASEEGRPSYWMLKDVNP